MEVKKPVALVFLLLISTGIGAADFSVNSLKEWNQGEFDLTSADRKNMSGELGIGYLNGSNAEAGALENGLVGYYRFERYVPDNDGSAIIDYSGRGNDGIYLANRTGGVLGTSAARFNGVDDFGELDDNTLEASDNSFTVTAWIKTNSSGEDKFIFDDKSGEGYSFLIDNYYGTDNLALYIGDGTDTQRLRGSTEIPSKEWHFAAGVFNGSHMKLYLNGSLDGERTASTFTPYQGTAGPYIADDTGGGDGFYNGKMDELRIYNRALNQEEIKDLYFDSKPFNGSYTSKTKQNPVKHEWNSLEVKASIPEATSLTAEFRAINSGTVVDKESINVEDGSISYPLSVSDSKKAQVHLTGESSKVGQTWEVDGFKATSEKSETSNQNIDEETPVTVEVAQRVAVDVSPSQLNYRGLNPGSKASKTENNVEKIEVENIGSVDINKMWINSSTPSTNPFGSGISKKYESGNFIQIKSLGDLSTPQNKKHYFINRKEFNESNDLSYISTEPGEDWRYGRFKVKDQNLFWAVRANDGSCTTQGSDLRVGKKPHNETFTGSNDFTDESSEYTGYDLQPADGSYVAPKVWVNTSKTSKQYDVVAKCGQKTWTIRTKHNIQPNGVDLTSFSRSERSSEYLINSARDGKSLQPGEQFSLNTAINIPLGVAQGTINTGTTRILVKH
jgi:hypothetical protein